MRSPEKKVRERGRGALPSLPLIRRSFGEGGYCFSLFPLLPLRAKDLLNSTRPMQGNRVFTNK
jgi:hypothetical protein